MGGIKIRLYQITFLLYGTMQATLGVGFKF